MPHNLENPPTSSNLTPKARDLENGDARNLVTGDITGRMIICQVEEIAGIDTKQQKSSDSVEVGSFPWITSRGDKTDGSQPTTPDNSFPWITLRGEEADDTGDAASSQPLTNSYPEIEGNPEIV
ncbi:hypothetical protein ACMFMG_001120 [Clarireedia jacksonii]